MLSVVGIAAGTALVVGLFGVIFSIEASAQRSVELAGRGDLEIIPASDTGLDAAVLEAVRADAALTDSFEIYEQAAVIDGRVSYIVALDRDNSLYEAQGLTGSLARMASAAEHGVTLHSRLASELDVGPGDTVSVTIGAMTMSLQVEAVMGGSQVGDLSAGNVAVLSSDIFTSAFESARPSRVVLGIDDAQTQRSAEQVRLQAQLGEGVVVRSPADRIAEVRSASAVFVQPAAFLAMLGLLVGGFLVFNTMSLAVAERFAELAILRSVGSRRRQIVGFIIIDAATVGVLGVGIGIGAGILIARSIVGRIPAVYDLLTGVSISFSMSPTVVALAILLGVGASLLGALPAARRAAAIEPMTVMRLGSARASSLPSSKHALSVFMLVLGVLGLLLGGRFAAQGSLGTRTLVTSFGGVLMAIFGSRPYVGRATASIAKRFGSAGLVAAATLRNSGARVWASVATVALCSTVALVTVGFAVNFRTTTADSVASLSESSFYVSIAGPGEVATVPLGDELATSISQVDGVSSVVGTALVPMRQSGQRFILFAVDGQSNVPAFALASQTARDTVLVGDGAIVTRPFAALFGLDVGARLALQGPAGEVELTVVDIVNTPSVSTNGTVVVAFPVAQSLTAIGTPSMLEVELLPGTDSTEARTQLVAIAARQPAPVQVASGVEVLRANLATVDQSLAVFYSVVVVMTTIAAIVLLNTMVASVLERTSEFGVLLAVGATTRFVRRAIWVEAVAIAAVGAALGAVFGTLVHFVLVASLEQNWPFPIRYRFVPLALVVAFATTMLAVAACGIATRRAGRLDIVEAIRGTE